MGPSGTPCYTPVELYHASASVPERTQMPFPITHITLGAWIFCWTLAPGLVPSALTATRMNGVDVFARFTQHIERQTEIDKRAFAVASKCMTWFYKQLRERPAPPAMQRIAWSDAPIIHAADQPQDESAECRALYPGGLEAVRTDFQRTQSFLSLSLTFYEFALVGDGDDNSLYSTRELQDLLLALSLSVEPSLDSETHLRLLTSRFDMLHEARGMEALMAGMNKLYDQSYRVTPANKAHLNQVME